MGDRDIFKEGVWVLALTHVSGHLGRIKGEAVFNDEIRNMYFTRKRVLVLDIIFDYFSQPQVRMVPQPSPRPPIPMLARDPIVIPFEFTNHPLSVAVDWARLVFFGDMHPEDMETYFGFMRQAMKQVESQRAQKAGLVVGDAALNAMKQATRQ